MVEWGGLENRCALTGTVGSNPTLSARGPGSLSSRGRAAFGRLGPANPAVIGVAFLRPNQISDRPMDRLSDSTANRKLSAEVLERALHATDIMVAITDPSLDDNPIVWVNDYFCQFTGYSRDEALGQNCRFLQGDDRDQPAVRRVRQSVDDGESIHVLIRNYKKSGDFFYNDLFISPVWKDRDNPDSEIIYFVGVQNDVTDRVQAETDVADREREIGETAENERERFGMDLHDGLGQELAGVGMLAQALSTRLLNDGSPEAAAAREVAQRIQSAITSAHSMARGLNPVGPYDTGLGDALRELASATSLSSGLSVEADVDRVEFADRREARHLYRIAQEAVANAVEHAEATAVLVSLHSRSIGDHTEAVLTVADDGVGISPDVSAHSSENGLKDKAALARRGTGLYGMRHRADLIGADLDIEPREGGGTKIRCTLRLSNTAAPEGRVRTGERE